MVCKVSKVNMVIWLCCLAGTYLFLLGPSQASAEGVALLINDYAEQPLSGTLLGPVTNSSIQITQEGTNILGGVDAHFEYLSNDPNAPAPGVTLSYNYNIYEDAAHTILSDTWNIVITGHTPTSADDSNVSFDSHFRSDSLNEVVPPPLAGGVLQAITENQFLPPPSNRPDDTYQYVFTPTGAPLLSDLTLGFNSAVPEPSACILLGIGVLGVGCYTRLRRKRVREPLQA